MLVYYFVDVYVITQFTKCILPKVTFINEMRALLPILVRAMAMGLFVYSLGYIISSDIMLIIVGMIVGIMSYATITLLTGSQEAYYLVGIIKREE